MADYIAVPDIPLPDLLKRHALFFDKFTFPRMRQVVTNSAADKSGHLRDLSWLYAKGILIDPPRDVASVFDSLEPNNLPMVQNVDFEKLTADMDVDKIKDNMRRIIGEIPDVPAVSSEVSDVSLTEAISTLTDMMSQVPPEFYSILEQILPESVTKLFMGFGAILFNDMPTMARQMAMTLRQDHNINAYPLLAMSELSRLFGGGQAASAVASSADVIGIVLNRLPQPDDLVPWEQILEYRNDPDSRGKILALRNWMHEVAKAELSPIEIEEKLDYLIHEYEAHMKLHKMKINKGVLETVLVTAAEVLEGTVKLKWSDAARALFVLKHRKIALLEAEMSSPGSEIAYITDARRIFAE